MAFAQKWGRRLSLSKKSLGPFFSSESNLANHYMPYLDVNDVVLRLQSSTTNCQYPELVSRMKDVAAFLDLSIHSFRRGRGYNWQIVTVFNLRSPTQKRSELSFLSLLEVNTIGDAHSVIAGSIAFSASIRFISAVKTCPTVRLAMYGAKETGLTSLLVRPARCSDTFIHLRCPTHMLPSFLSIFRKAVRYCSKLAGNCTFSLQSFLRVS